MKGVLLVNLGSPDSTNPKDVKKYLDEFLMDPRVIDVPYWFRSFLVRGIILNTRPKKSAEAYQTNLVGRRFPANSDFRKTSEENPTKNHHSSGYWRCVMEA